MSNEIHNVVHRIGFIRVAQSPLESAIGKFFTETNKTSINIMDAKAFTKEEFLCFQHKTKVYLEFVPLSDIYDIKLKNAVVLNRVYENNRARSEV